MRTKQENCRENKNAVVAWFGESFHLLHPELQRLHRQGGSLSGKIELNFGTGLAGFIGKRIAKRLDVPLSAGGHELRVDIHQRGNNMHWSRCFDGRHKLLSVFEPRGTYPDGYWLETTGPVSLRLTVDIVESAWYWRVIAIRAFGLPVPMFLLPHSQAYKQVVDGLYRFHVGFSMPGLGRLFSYEGSLVYEAA